jgi:hypothetical protein
MDFSSLYLSPSLTLHFIKFHSKPIKIIALQSNFSAWARLMQAYLRKRAKCTICDQSAQVMVFVGLEIFLLT